MRSLARLTGLVRLETHVLETTGGALTAGVRLRRSIVLRWALGLLAGLAIFLAAVHEAIPTGGSSGPVGARARDLTAAGLIRLPLAARGPVSQALGADSTAYRIDGSAGSYEAANPAQHLSASFSATGVAVRSGKTRVALRLVGIGHGSPLEPVAAAVPTEHANRVSYRRAGLDEWYVNGPLGLEQGFTIVRAPVAHGGATGSRSAGQEIPLTLAIALTTNARAAIGRGHQSITFSRPGETPLQYTGMSATDAGGHTLHSWLTLEGARLLLHVQARGARYPLRIDPLVQQGSKLTGAGESGSAHFGFSVALSGDGKTALIGAPENDGKVGAAWVFVYSHGEWTQQGEALTGKEESGSGEFGYSVALSGEGNTALIGGETDESSAGAAWAFTRSGETWTQQGPKLVLHGEPTGVNFGHSVALDHNGNTALIGATGFEKAEGAAYIWTRSGSTWTEGPRLTGGGEENGAGVLGWSVALSENGSTALVGAPNDSPGGVTRAGAVWVFTRVGEAWKQQGKPLGGGEGEGKYLGTGVALSATGSTALIGATGGGLKEEPAFVFTRSGETWSEQAHFKGTGETSTSNFGASVAVSASGNTALVGGGGYSGLTGAVWDFQRSGSSWSEVGSALTGSGESGEGQLGERVAISENGRTALFGGPGDATGAGASWVFAVPPPTAETGLASEIMTTTATLNATVNPEGEASYECAFEYGITAYEKTVACSSTPPGESPVAVSAPLEKLTPNTTYHFRITIGSSFGTTYGGDETFTTLEHASSATTKEESKPQEAKYEGLSVVGRGGIGTVTIGPYGSDIGGPPLLGSNKKYFQIYHGAGSSFTKLEYKDCELGGAKALWWDNPATGWEPILPPVAVYSEGPPACITVTATETTTPSVAQLEDPRHVGGPPGNEEYGKCEKVKHGYYKEGACLTLYTKNGKAEQKGKYEWLPDPAGSVTCFPMKDGLFKEEKCATPDVNKKGKPVGKFEAGVNTFSGTGGLVKIEFSGAPIECESSSFSGAVLSTKVANETLLFRVCKRGSEKCHSEGASEGTILLPMEVYGYEEDQHQFTVLAAKTPLSFKCGESQLTLTGGVSGEITSGLNAMGTRIEAVFASGVGEQVLSIQEASGNAIPATFSTSTVTSATQASELKTSG